MFRFACLPKRVMKRFPSAKLRASWGLTKGALYRHYANKQAIFESILQKMEQLDAERAQAFELPEGTVQDMPQSYEIATPEALCAFSKAQFRYWAQDEFAAPFRRMLTIEQYRNEQMAALYQQYLAGGRLAMCGICWRQWLCRRGKRGRGLLCAAAGAARRL